MLTLQPAFESIEKVVFIYQIFFSLLCIVQWRPKPFCFSRTSREEIHVVITLNKQAIKAASQAMRFKDMMKGGGVSTQPVTTASHRGVPSSSGSCRRAGPWLRGQDGGAERTPGVSGRMALFRWTAPPMEKASSRERNCSQEGFTDIQSTKGVSRLKTDDRKKWVWVQCCQNYSLEENDVFFSHFFFFFFF